MDSDKKENPAADMQKELENLRKSLNSITHKQERIETKDHHDSPKVHEELVTSVKDLDASIKHLIRIFERAGEIMQIEVKDEQQKVDQILAQNKEIAKGVIAVADIVKKGRIVAPTDSYDPQYHLSFDRKQKFPEESTPVPPRKSIAEMLEPENEPRRPEGTPKEPRAPSPPSTPKEDPQWELPPAPDEDIPEPPEEEGFFSRFKK